jgi:hypothetical protein
VCPLLKAGVPIIAGILAVANIPGFARCCYSCFILMYESLWLNFFLFTHVSKRTAGFFRIEFMGVEGGGVGGRGGG